MYMVPAKDLNASTLQLDGNGKETEVANLEVSLREHLRWCTCTRANIAAWIAETVV